MPERYLDDDGRVIDLTPDPRNPTVIAACTLCDDDGYRGSVVCDHRDHAAESAHGRELARAELERIRQRKAKRARGVTA